MQKFTSFAEAIKANNMLAVKEMLDENPTLIHSVTPEGISMVMLAAYHRYSKLLEVLVVRKRHLDIFEAAATGVLREVERNVIKNKINLIEYSPDGYTALHFAAWFGHYEVAKYLIMKGSNINAVSKNDSKVTPLHSAVAAGYGDIASLLAERGADVNAKQGDGNTPLHVAVTNGHARIVQMLLEKGADPSVKNNLGKTPADLAREKKMEEVSKLLEKN